MDKNLSKFHDEMGESRPPKNLWEKLISPIKINSPGSATMDDWLDWRKTSKKTYPIRYWLTETLPVSLHILRRKFLSEPIWWVRYRTIDRTNVISINSLKPGWHDRSERLLHASFQILVDFVELELSRAHSGKTFLSRYRRNPEAGLKHLEWEINDPDCNVGNYPTQSDLAKEKRELYLWWTKRRPYRWDIWTCPEIWGPEKKKNKDAFGDTTMDTNRYTKAELLDAFYVDEDDEMLSRLIKIRHSLWT
jgi:hypothetical protein